MWCIPPAQSAEFVAKMEDVLEVYSRPYDPKRPVVCMDEQPFQLLAETRELIPMSEQNHTVKADHEYERRGACCVFMATEPLGGYRHTEVRGTRTKKDWADFVAALLEGPYADAEKVVLVMDNLNTHGISSLYERFPPGAARRYAERLEIHFTPKHGSWLDIAEIELAALTAQCFRNRRIGSIEELAKETSAWESSRNEKQKGVDWQFTTSEARTRLKHLYPIIEIGE